MLSDFFSQRFQSGFTIRFEKTFYRFSLVKINSQNALLKAKTRTPFHIQINDKVFEFVLTENDLRSPDFKAESTDKDGKKTESRDTIITTFKGKLSGENGSVVRMSLDGQKIEGFISTQTRADYFIEQAAKYSTRAASDDIVVYQVKDKINNPVINLGLDGQVAQIKNGVDKQAKVELLKTVMLLYQV